LWAVALSQVSQSNNSCYVSLLGYCKHALNIPAIVEIAKLWT